MRDRLTALEIMLITDGVGDPERILRIVSAAVEGGVRCVQLRERSWTGGELARSCESLWPLLDAADGLLLVNDRADLCAAGLAHGVHLPGHGLSFEQGRRAVGAGAVCGAAAHSFEDLERAVAAGLDYATLSPLFATSCKPGATTLGVQRASDWARRVALPTLWLGGVDATTAAGLRARGAAGVAVRSALCGADDVVDAGRSIRAAFEA